MMDTFHVRGQMFQNQVHWQGSYGEPNPEVIGICLQCIAALLVGFAIGKVLCWLRDAGETRGSSEGPRESSAWMSLPPPDVLFPPVLYRQREPEFALGRLPTDIYLRTPLPRVREPEVTEPLPPAPPPTPRRRRPEVLVPPESWRIALQPEPPLYPRPRPPYGGRGLEDFLQQVRERGGAREPADRRQRAERMEGEAPPPRPFADMFDQGLHPGPERRERRARPREDAEVYWEFEGGQRRRV